MARGSPSRNHLKGLARIKNCDLSLQRKAHTRAEGCNKMVVTSPARKRRLSCKLIFLSPITIFFSEMVTLPAISIESCSKEHQKIYKEWFNIADSDGDGRFPGNDATKFFAMSKLSRQELKTGLIGRLELIADSKRQGFLGLAEFITAMKLVSLAQEGHEITSDLLKGSVDIKSVELPALEGLENVVSNQKASYVDVEDEGVTQPQATAKTPWFKTKSITKPWVDVVTIVDGLKRLYTEKLKPLEITYHFNDFASPLLTNSDFEAKPMVMLLGEYSTGNTTFIKHLLGCEYPGAHIGPEPTTDRFVVANEWAR